MPYTVRWEIQIEADSPTEAAKTAHKYMLDPDSSAVCFDVEDEEGDTHFIDLWVEEL